MTLMYSKTLRNCRASPLVSVQCGSGGVGAVQQSRLQIGEYNSQTQHHIVRQQTS